MRAVRRPVIAFLLTERMRDGEHEKCERSEMRVHVRHVHVSVRLGLGLSP